MREPKTVREWYDLIVIIVLVEFIVLHFIYTKILDEDAQRAWEFGHVLVAIILAVIAIIYAIFQGMTQESNTQKLSTQIDSLQKVVADVTGSKDELRSELGQIGKVTAKLEEIATGVKAHDVHLANVKGSVDDLAAQIAGSGKKKDSQSGTQAISEESFTSMLRNLRMGGTGVAYAIYRVNGNVTDEDIVSKAFAPAQMTKDDTEARKDWLEALWRGQLIGMKQTFEALGCIDTAEENAHFLPKYYALVEAYFKTPLSFISSSTIFDKIKVQVDELAATAAKKEKKGAD